MRLIERLRIAFTRTRFADAIKPDVDALAAKAAEISGECNEALSEAAVLRKKILVSPHNSETAALNLAALGETLGAFDGHELRIHDLVAEFHEVERVLLERV